MKFKVALYEHEEGVAVFCPGLQGCASQGDTVEEALENIQSAIREYLEVSWIVFKRNMAKDIAEDATLKATFDEVEVDVKGVEEADPEEVEAVI